MRNNKENVNDYPKFAVVGHPNKGKSSIVSSLALDDSVQIGDTPGTTQIKRGFPLKVDGKIIYELFDTPGFQRARRVLAWLNEQDAVSADKRSDVVREFVATHRHDDKFRDEIELLEPILDGAGIIYVVDASKPYGPEYEVEMEILRWCGQPSMAILNLIGDEDYRDQWKSALGHYFRMVRTFNPIEATFRDHMDLLESMAQLKEEWTKEIKVAITILDELHQQKVEQTIDAIVDNMIKTLSLVYKQEIKGEKATSKEEEDAKQGYRQQIMEYEKAQEKAIEFIWNHRSIEKIENVLVLDEVGLFSKESASIFGLSQNELILTGASAGAITGAGVDLMLAGHTLFIASLVGGVVGGVGAMFGFNNLYSLEILGQNLGKRELSIGPMKNLNFPYILLGRALYHASVIAKRSHALRESIKLEDEEFYTEQIINTEMRKKLEKVHIQLRKGEGPSNELLDEYKKVISRSFLGLLRE
ncbi:GTPase/DUF3482 domain-containing protein [bacterium]|nr:GTPase/DUF3482 domain-containing protein [bacterium]MBU1958758.1 GTPase/DUF3482 domain-containing protein [bacterium]